MIAFMYFFLHSVRIIIVILLLFFFSLLCSMCVVIYFFTFSLVYVTWFVSSVDTSYLHCSYFCSNSSSHAGDSMDLVKNSTIKQILLSCFSPFLQNLSNLRVYNWYFFFNWGILYHWRIFSWKVQQYAFLSNVDCFPSPKASWTRVTEGVPINNTLSLDHTCPPPSATSPPLHVSLRM